MNTTSNGSKQARWKNRSGERPSAGAAAGTASATPPQTVASDSPRIRIILADSEAIFRVGMSKIFALQDDLEIVAQTETLAQTLNAVATIPCDIVLFESGLSPSPPDAVSEVGRRALPGAKVILVTPRAGEQETVDYLRRGVRGILARAVSPDLLVRCVRKVAAGETWLDKQGVNWVIEAYRTQALQGTAPQRQLRLSDKEMRIISGVTQGMKNKDIAREVQTTEQVVKNYLRKIYDKLNVADRLELALYSMHHRLLDGYVVPSTEYPASADKSEPPAVEAPAVQAARAASAEPAKE
ncbi:MAG TPA: response regulator transcription factor [Candidatus Binatia bacterium]|nr:response regulator transcription factor [Candidatus Binatia bacterium]